MNDRIRFVRVPPNEPPETVRLFQKLIARKRSVRVCEIDEFGNPWIACRFRRKNNTWEYHSLAIMEGESWVKVRKKKLEGR